MNELSTIGNEFTVNDIKGGGGGCINVESINSKVDVDDDDDDDCEPKYGVDLPDDEHDVDVSLANNVDDALLAGIVSNDDIPLQPPLDDQRELDGDDGCGLVCEPFPFPLFVIKFVGDFECASFFNRFSLARRFWNQT